MLAIVWYLILMKIFILTDCVKLKIPNVIVIPGIALGCYLTGNWLPALIMFFVGALLFSKESLGGGDVKLLTMAGSFLGIYALYAFVLSKVLVYLYRILRNENRALPYTPFLYLSSLPFIWIMCN